MEGAGQGRLKDKCSQKGAQRPFRFNEERPSDQRNPASPQDQTWIWRTSPDGGQTQDAQRSQRCRAKANGCTLGISTRRHAGPSSARAQRRAPSNNPNPASQVTQQEVEREVHRFGPTSNVWVAKNPAGFAFVVRPLAASTPLRPRQPSSALVASSASPPCAFAAAAPRRRLALAVSRPSPPQHVCVCVWSAGLALVARSSVPA